MHCAVAAASLNVLHDSWEEDDPTRRDSITRTRPTDVHIGRMITIRLHASILLCTIAFGAFGACGSSTATASAREPTVQVTGAFLADGSCTVSTDGVPLFAPEARARTTYVRGRALNMAPAGFEVHEIWCAPASAGEPLLPDRPDERAFFINVYAPTGKLAPVQRYVIVRGMPTSGGSATAIRANLSLFGHDSAAQGASSNGIGVTYLTGAVGDVTLTHVDSALVVGTFRALAVRERSMM